MSMDMPGSTSRQSREADEFAPGSRWDSGSAIDANSGVDVTMTDGKKAHGRSSPRIEKIAP